MPRSEPKKPSWLCRLLGCSDNEDKNPPVLLHLLVGSEVAMQKDPPMPGLQIEVTKGFKRKISAHPTAKGAPVELDSIVDIRQAGTINSGATGAAVEGDPLSVWVFGTGDVGDTNFEIFADKRKGPDVVEIVVPVLVHVKDPEADSLGIDVSDEEPITPVATPTPAEPGAAEPAPTT